MGWHVLHTHVAQEQRLARFLAERNVLVFAPEIKITKPRTIIQPFFPRYVLACADLNNGDIKSLIKNAQGLHSILEFCGRPATVSVAEVMLIQSRIRDGYVRLDDYIGVDTDRFHTGDRVEITGEGVFAGHRGAFSRYLNGKDRVRILLYATGLFTGAAIEISERDVALVSSGRIQ